MAMPATTAKAKDGFQTKACVLLLQGMHMLKHMRRNLSADAMPTISSAEMPFLPQLSGLVSAAASFSAVSTTMLVQADEPNAGDQRTRTISDGALLLEDACTNAGCTHQSRQYTCDGLPGVTTSPRLLCKTHVGLGQAQLKFAIKLIGSLQPLHKPHHHELKFRAGSLGGWRCRNQSPSFPCCCSPLHLLCH